MSRFTTGLQAFIDELRRRHVFRVATAYGVGAFVALEAASLLFEGLLVPAWVYRALTVMALVGFPIVLVLAWLFEWTSRGIHREAPLGALAATDTEAPHRMVGANGAARAGRPAAGRESGASQTVRAFAFASLGLVIAVVGLGLTLPYVSSQQPIGAGDGAADRGTWEGVVRTSSSDAVATLAVLPFVSLTGGDDAGFADGLAEDVTAALAQLGSVDVVSRTTSEAYRGSDKTAPEIGREIGVGLIVEGTIRRAGDQVRVTVQLIDAATDRHLWANSYDRSLTGDIFSTQSQLAQEIVAAIRSVVIPAQEGQAVQRVHALRLSEEGHRLLERGDPAYDDAAAGLFSEAIAADSSAPEPHAGLALSLLSRVPNGPPFLLDSAAAHADSALALNPDLPAGHVARALVLTMRGQVDSALVDLRRAIILEHGDANYMLEWTERVRTLAPGMERAARALREAAIETGRRNSAGEAPGAASSPPDPPAAGSQLTP